MATYEIDTLKDGAGNVYHLNPYTLPIASATVLGAIKVGSGLSIDSTTGVLSASGLGTETDPIFTASPAHGITSTDITNWNSAYAHGVTNKGSAFTSDLYKITTNSEGHVTAATSVVKSDITNLGIPAQDTTYSAFAGASSSAAGDEGLVPTPLSGDQDKLLFGDGNWTDLILSGGYDSNGYSVYLNKDGSTTGTSALIRGGTHWYGTSSTTASTSAKVVTCSSFVLHTGATISVLFSTANTAATPTLNVNSTGAKSIYVGTSTPSSTTNVLKWSANTLLTFIYDGTYYRYISSVSAGSVSPSRGANTWYGTCSTAEGTAAKTASIDNFVLTKGAIVSLQMTTQNTATAAITLNVNSTGAKTIYYKNSATSSTNWCWWGVGHVISFIYDGTYWRVLNDREIGAGSGIKRSPGSNGYAEIIVADLLSYTALTNAAAAATEVANRVYPVALDSASHLAVNVPWTDTTYADATTSASGLMSSSDKTKLDSLSVEQDVTAAFEEADSAWSETLTVTDYKMLENGSTITIEVVEVTTSSAASITMPYTAECPAFALCGAIESTKPVIHSVVAVAGTTLFMPEVTRASFTLMFKRTMS